MYYDKELAAIRRFNRERQRRVYEENLKDFASNDYLGLAHKKQLLKAACKRVEQLPYHAPKASQLINGYTLLHQAFEEYLCSLQGFEAAITVGSGFLANLAVIEALVRKGDTLLLDEEFHASGVLASRLVERVEFFKHNDALDLQKRLQKVKGRALIGIEGIYSMSGDLCNREIFEVAGEHLLLLDEAHSVGVVGEKLLGVMDLFGITPQPNIIKMGTLGKAIGSYGAYILASKEIIHFLQNRAKSIIYTTALSLMDVALAMEGFLYIQKNLSFLKKEIKKREEIIRSFGLDTQSLIVDIEAKDVLAVQKRLLQEGFLVGAIRPPTVPKPILRIIARLGESSGDLRHLLERIDVLVQA